MTALTWVTCDGGPHLFAASEWVESWSGAEPPSDGRVVEARSRWGRDQSAPASDYDAACDIDDLIGSVKVGGGTGLVLGDEVPMSTWVASPLFAGGLLLVRWNGRRQEHLVDFGAELTLVPGREIGKPRG